MINTQPQVDNVNTVSKSSKLERNVICLEFLNAQSLISKIDQLSVHVDNYMPDFIGVAETWLEDSHSESDVKLANYKIEMRNRSSNANRGGLLLYIKNELFELPELQV